ncbi:SH3 domain-containing protein [Zhengella sp. ZM62]|uniref:SH3 domain-containing protein n=1 Tax=Zhengella sedimenti TaxID=3390035 RepID=UPI0039759131
MRHLVLSGLAIAAVLATPFMIAAPAAAGEAQAAVLGPSGLPLPRFVSLKASQANLRIGPGTTYPVDWTYVKRGLPLEIIQEYDTWRRVRDADGTEGWVSQGLLSGRRTVVAAPWDAGTGALLDLMAKPGEGAGRLAQVEPGAMGDVIACGGQWCHVNFSGTKGWMEQARLWGVYPGEKVED